MCDDVLHHHAVLVAQC